MCIIVKNNKSLFIFLYMSALYIFTLTVKFQFPQLSLLQQMCVCVLYVGGWVYYVDLCVCVCMLRSRSILCNSGILLLILKFVQSTVIP